MTDNQILVKRINTFLNLQLKELQPHNTGQLLNAMQYTLLNGGKRMRPLLVYAAAESLELNLDIADHIAAAIEMIHAYSLIHDDLPAMDDDDLRRGQATCHIKFDEATAILAADALQALAFQCLSQTPTSADVVVRLIQNLSSAAGTIGMVGGQILDLEAEGKSIDLTALEEIHSKKTGALLQACVTMVTDCYDKLTPDDSSYYLQFAKNFGMAYQIIDDVLDVTSDTLTLGKPAQSDIKNNKSTYPTVVGLTVAKSMADQLINNCHKQLAHLKNTNGLKILTEIIANRSH